MSIRLSHIKPIYLKVFLLIIYAVGVVGITCYPDRFISLTPFNLLLTCALLMVYHPVNNPQFIRYAIFLFTAGFAVEMLGVQTGKIFGNYYYGYALGYKLKDVPLIIGVNWVMLILATHSIAHKLSQHMFIGSAIGAALMVFLDYFIEQVASQYAFWHWHQDVIPLQNYIAWFIISFLFHGLGYVLNFKKENSMAVFIFVLQLSFFIILNLVNFFHQ
jgi:putative membrane protein